MEVVLRASFFHFKGKVHFKLIFYLILNYIFLHQLQMMIKLIYNDV